MSLILDRVPQNIADLLLHGSPIAGSPPLDFALEHLIQVPNNQLRHGVTCYRIQQSTRPFKSPAIMIASASQFSSLKSLDCRKQGSCPGYVAHELSGFMPP